MREIRLTRLILWLCAATLAPGSLSSASPQQDGFIEDQARVARVAGIEGQVSLFRDPEEGWRSEIECARSGGEPVWTGRCISRRCAAGRQRLPVRPRYRFRFCAP